MKSPCFLFVLLFALSASADGPADNLPDKVRPVPRKGASIAASDRQELEDGIARLGSEIDALRSKFKTNLSQLALLPDVQIFHNAVRYALRYDEIFNPTNEVPAAKSFIKQGLER